MNPNRAIYGRLTINDEKKSLGRAPGINEMLQRIQQQYLKSEYRGENLRLIVELSFEEIPQFESIMSRQQQLEAEAQSMMITDQSEEVFPGITLARVNEVYFSPEYKAYEHVCAPENRIGLDESEIARIRQSYAERFPDCIDKFPLWRDSIT